MVTSTQQNCLTNTVQEEQQLYDHLLECVQLCPPEELLEIFRRLFIKGKEYDNVIVRQAIAKIVNRKGSEQQFTFLINRCCHILINRWQMQPGLQSYIPDLVAMFENLPMANSAYSTSSARLRQLVINFTKTDYYLKLQRLARVIRENKESTSVGNLINRYPYLYEHYLLTEDSSYEDQQAVKHIQSRIQRNFELNLSHYVTYRLRQAQMSRNGSSNGKVLTPIRDVKNPTLLSERELGTALKHFVGRVENGNTYRDISHSFLTHTSSVPSYKKFKKDLYEYLISSIDDRYGKHNFNEKLYRKIDSILPQCDAQKPDEFMILRTSTQLMNFLIVESAQRPNHYVFVDIITNLGPTSTVGLLLKLVLICRKVKPYLEKRFSILFSHYESFNKDGVPWLIKSLENLHIALSVHYGKADLSFLRQIF